MGIESSISIIVLTFAFFFISMYIGYSVIKEDLFANMGKIPDAIFRGLDYFIIITIHEGCHALAALLTKQKITDISVPMSFRNIKNMSTDVVDKDGNARFYVKHQTVIFDYNRAVQKMRSKGKVTRFIFKLWYRVLALWVNVIGRYFLIPLAPFIFPFTLALLYFQFNFGSEIMFDYVAPSESIFFGADILMNAFTEAISIANNNIFSVRYAIFLLLILVTIESTGGCKSDFGENLIPIAMSTGIIFSIMTVGFSLFVPASTQVEIVTLFAIMFANLFLVFAILAPFVIISQALIHSKASLPQINKKPKEIKQDKDEDHDTDLFY